MKLELVVRVLNDKQVSILLEHDITDMINSETKKLIEAMVPFLDDLRKTKLNEVKNED